jgi:hypothetical protein
MKDADDPVIVDVTLVASAQQVNTMRWRSTARCGSGPHDGTQPRRDPSEFDP